MTRTRRSPRIPADALGAGRRRARPSARPLITAAVFDLDDTLYDCLGQRVQAAHRAAAQAMARAGVPAPVEEILRRRLEAFKTNPTLSYIDAEVCRSFGISDCAEISRRAREAFFALPVGRLRLFPGARKLLRELKRRGVRIFIASFGDAVTQHAKVVALGLHREPSVERVFYADTGNVVTKEAVFRSVLRNVEPEAARVLVVGDRPSSEIRAGKDLGMHTVRIRHGEFAALEPAGPEERADFEVGKIEEVLKLPLRFGAKKKT